LVKPDNAAEDPDELPPEDRELYEKQLGLKPELVDGQIAQPEFEPPKVLAKENKEPKNFMSSLSEQAGKDIAYYAGQEKFEFEMDDGTIKKYNRVSPVQYEWDEIEDLRAEVEGGESLTEMETDAEGKQVPRKLTKREIRLKTRLLEPLKAKYYLREVKTNKPMSAEEHAHIKNSSRVGSILSSCVVVSLHQAVQGKK
jgi:hypothetical protein